MLGQTLGHYKILEKLGAGGMGEVYRAEDTTLDRQVALKVLPAQLAESQERLDRFEREAKTLAALDHPNIVHIYTVEEEDGVRFLTMQLVEGQPLSQMIPKGGMPLERIFEIAVPLADALAAAHEKGVIHRDLKPANIMISDDGRVKVLDFGLAKLRQGTETPLDSELPTEPLTDEGKIVGTMPYMSPEQLEGKEIDHRSDIFSLGVVLYEMATGERPFKGDSSASLITAIMSHSPREVDSLRAELPHHLGRIVRRCLEKEVTSRFQTARDICNEIQGLRKEVESSRQQREETPPATTPSRFSMITVKVLGAAAILAVVLAVILPVLTSRDKEQGRVLADSDVILLTDIENRTGDPVFDGTLKQALAIKLEESPFLNLISERKVRETLRMLGRESTDRVTPEVGQEICQRQGIKAVVSGDIVSLGNNYVITINAVECATGNSLARQQVEAAGKEDVLTSVGEATRSLREDLGESLASIEQFDAPVDRATTSSLEALNSLYLAEEALNHGHAAGAIPFLERALEIDPDFALAHAQLGTIYSNLSEWEKAVYHKTRAYELRDRVTQDESLYITAHYHDTVTGELSKQIESYELFKQTYPRNSTPPNNLAFMYNEIGWYHKAAEEAELAVKLGPEHHQPYFNLSKAYRNLGQFKDSQRVLDEAAAQGLEFIGLLTNRYLLAYLEGDTTTMQQMVVAARGDRRESEILILEAEVAAAKGRLREAQRLTRRAVKSAKVGGFEERASAYLAQDARWEAAFGNLEAAAAQAAGAMELVRNRDSLPVAAFTLALAGKIDEAETLISELSLRFPTDTVIQSVWIAVGRAAIEWHRHDPRAVVDILEQAAPYERAFLIVIYLRGHAYLELNQPNKARAEFQKVLDLRGVKPTLPMHNLSHLGLARASAASGDIKTARQQFETFFSLMADSDDALPVLDLARREYSGLFVKHSSEAG